MPPILPPADAPRAPFRLGRRPERLQAIVGVPLDVAFLKSLVAAGAAAAEVSRAEMLSPLRDRTVAVHRQAGMWIAYHATLRSLPEIGRAFSRDHSTVLHAIRATERRLESEAEETADVIRRIALNLLRKTPPLTRDEEIRRAADAAKARKEAAAARRAAAQKYGGGGREAGSRTWFVENDARFCAAFVAAHPERVGEAMPA